MLVVKGQTLKLHLIPSGILHENVLCLMADGTVIDPECLAGEYNGLRERGISCSNLRISGNAHVIMPYHRLLDGLQEEARGAGSIGTTRRGIGPVYTDKVARMPEPVRMWDLLDADVLRQRVALQLEQKNLLLAALYNHPPMDVKEVVDEVMQYVPVFHDCITDTRTLLYDKLAEEANIVFEGAQGTFLDLDYGTYPFVTSSHPVAGGACLGTGIGPTFIDDVLIVSKAYTTRVGAGVFPTEQDNPIGDLIRERGKEYGTTTGRPRRCGWLDGVALRTAARMNGATGLALTLLDVLNTFETINICVAYRHGGTDYTLVPANDAVMHEAETVYEELPGWQEDICACRTFADLPPLAQAYCRRVAEIAEVPLYLVSLGPGREETIFLNE